MSTHFDWRLALVGFGCAVAVAACTPTASQPEPTAASSAESPAAPAKQEGPVKVKVYNKQGQLVGPVESSRVMLTDEQWKARLTADQFKVCRMDGTESPGTSALLKEKADGVFVCTACGLPLFESGTKFESNTGWPSFFRPIAAENVVDKPDDSYGMSRVENECARCGSHLGHVFEDGPPPTGKRYCMNGEALRFVAADQFATLADPAAESVGSKQ